MIELLGKKHLKMPQEHYVLRCFSCETFQVHIVKKAKKWECKMCGAKQSLKRSYGRGSGKDCRAHVMKLNELRMLKGNDFDGMESESLDETSTCDMNSKLEERETLKTKPLVSKWSDYLETPCEEEKDDEENENLETTITHDIFPKERKKKRKAQCMNIGWNKGKKLKVDSVKPDFPHLASSVEDLFNPTTTKCIQETEPDKRNVLKSNDGITSNFKSTEKLKHSKYSKYLSEEDLESNNEVIVNSNKKSNIFNADIDDLDDILNF